jgi:hypothetical protein
MWEGVVMEGDGDGDGDWKGIVKSDVVGEKLGIP